MCSLFLQVRKTAGGHLVTVHLRLIMPGQLPGCAAEDSKTTGEPALSPAHAADMTSLLARNPVVLSRGNPGPILIGAI
jgi:hypothetical protein